MNFFRELFYRVFPSRRPASIHFSKEEAEAFEALLQAFDKSLALSKAPLPNKQVTWRPHPYIGDEDNS